MKDPKMLAITARMDGERVIAKNIGKMVKVSEMELVALCTFARIGQLALFSELEGTSGEQAQASLDRLINGIRDTLSAPGTENGLNHLTQTCAAILGGERLGKYVVHERDETT